MMIKSNETHLNKMDSSEEEKNKEIYKSKNIGQEGFLLI